MAKFDMKEYARRGAETRVAELEQELAAIYGAFPELRSGRGRQGARKVVINQEEPTPGTQSARAAKTTNGARKRRKMTAAERKAVGDRMRRYWAARRKAAAK